MDHESIEVKALQFKHKYLTIHTMNTSRRQFLKTSFGLVSGCVLGEGLMRAAEAGTRKLPIGLQLYAVRGEFARSVPDTLKAIRRIGYQGVEFWGYGGTPNVYQNYSAKQLRQFLDDNGLKCCGMHHQLKAIESDTLKRTIENNQILGNRYIIVAAAPEKMGNLDSIRELAALLNGAATTCQAQRVRVGYHAHPFDFVKIDGRFAWDHLFSQTKPEVVMQMDVGNCLAGNGDPIAMLKKFPGRTQTIHIKEHQEKTFDSDYYKEVFHLCETTCRTRWYIVEMGGPNGDGFDVAEAALKKLHQLGK